MRGDRPSRAEFEDRPTTVRARRPVRRRTTEANDGEVRFASVRFGSDRFGAVIGITRLRFVTKGNASRRPLSRRHGGDDAGRGREPRETENDDG